MTWRAARLALAFALPLAVAAGAVFAPAARAGDEEGCVPCHRDPTQDAAARRPAVLFAKDVHAAAGFTCTDCHGGVDRTMDYVDAHDKARGFRGRPDAAGTTAVCGACHDDAARMKAGKASADLPVGQGKRFAESVHGRVKAVPGHAAPSCTSCHGAHGIRPAKDPESPSHPTHVPDTCARCHGDLVYMRAYAPGAVRVDQAIEYRTSRHGERLAKGDTKVAVCSSCHGSHDIRPASDPASSVHRTRVEETCGRCHEDAARMAGYTVAVPGGGTRPLPTDQVAGYRESVHHQKLVERPDAPTCADCHGNHGATTPDVRSVAQACARCHSRPAELFAASPLRAVLEREGRPACATCHGSHLVRRPDDEFLAAVAAGRTASGWAPDAALRGFLTGSLETLRRLERRLRDVEALVERVEDYGMDLTRARLDLVQARDGLARARVGVHAFDPSKPDEAVFGGAEEPGALALADRVEAQANEALGERTFRRVGLVVALAIIAALVAALSARIRRLPGMREGA